MAHLLGSFAGTIPTEAAPSLLFLQEPAPSGTKCETDGTFPFRKLAGPGRCVCRGAASRQSPHPDRAPPGSAAGVLRKTGGTIRPNNQVKSVGRECPTHTGVAWGREGPTSRKGREKWGTPCGFSAAGGQQVPPLRRVIRFADHPAPVGMTEFFVGMSAQTKAFAAHVRGAHPFAKSAKDGAPIVEVVPALTARSS